MWMDMDGKKAMNKSIIFKSQGKESSSFKFNIRSNQCHPSLSPVHPAAVFPLDSEECLQLEME